MEDDVAEPLVGGGDSGRIVRIGDTVRRPVRPWTPSVHRLLRHLEQVGFTHAPRVLGLDDQGRDTLTYIEGEDGRIARCYDDEALTEVATMIRELHDAAATFSHTLEDRWRPDPHARVET